MFAIKTHYENVIVALEKITQQNENADTRGEASTTLASISTFSFLCFLNLCAILPEVDSIQNYLQTKGLGQAMRAIESLLKFLTEQRNCLVNPHKKHQMHSDTAADAGLSFQDEMK